MKNYIRFTDTLTAEANVGKGISGKQYIKTKDSTSKSGHSLVTQIEMTHSGIVTRNLGFYLPDNMSAGAHTFTQYYKKPVLVGHDDETDPVGRVLDGKYISTAQDLVLKDKYFASLFNIVDKKKGTKNTLTDFVQYVIDEYWGKDNYRGLGHILGTLKITDEETIARILDERYLTVSTSMTSDAARCSECGQDWISEGMCEHKRGQTYDSGVPVVIIPGAQSYNHVGIVTEPADVFAAGFKTVEIIKDGVSNDISNKQDIAYKDKFSIAANLFSYSDSKLVSLSDDLQTDLIEVKNNIQEIEDSLKTENTAMTIADQISATISMWKSEGEGEDYKSMSIELRTYMKDLSPEEAAKLAQKALSALDSKEFKSEGEFRDALKTFIEAEMPASTEPATTTVDDSSQAGTPSMKVIKVLDGFKVKDGEEYEASLEETTLEEITKVADAALSKKESKELARIIVRSQKGDVLAKLTLDAAEKSVEECIAEFKSIKDNRFTLSKLSEKEILEKMNTYLSDDKKITDEAFEQLDSKSCAGSNKYFPVTSKETAEAARKVLGLAVSTDSLKGRVLGQIERLASSFVDATEDTTGTAVNENFDTTATQCDNQVELSDEKLLEDIKTMLDEASERDLLDQILSNHLVEKQQEIDILEQQLELANDEVAKLEGELKTLKDSAKKDLAEKVVDAKIKAGLFTVEDRESELASHLERSEDSLRDSMKDLSNFKAPASQKIAEAAKVENPVLQDAATSANEQFEKTEHKFDDKAYQEKKEKEKQKKYNLLRASKGKAFADNWLKSIA